MRIFIILLFLIVFFIVTLPLDLVLYIIGNHNPALRISICQKIVRAAFSCVMRLTGAEITVDGLENIPKDQPVLYMGNHQSYFDIPLTGMFIKSGAGYVAKKEMHKIPILRIWMKGINCLFLDRENIREGLKTILQGVEYLKQGYSMFIFPEGTRNPGDDLDMLPFKEGSTKMAEKAKVPIIPIAITGTANLLENNKRLKITPAKVHVSFGTPVIISELSKEERRFLGAYVQNIIKEMLESYKQQTQN